MLTKRIKQGEVIPRWYGIAYWEDLGNVAVCAPIPFNALVCIGRNIVRFFILFGKYDIAMKEYIQGYNAGWGDGYVAGAKTRIKHD
jgi:hypothetical protein